MQNKEARIRRWPFVVSLVIGIALILAPVAFQMFSRAPQGGRMITAFKPYMNEATISGFQGDMATIGRAVDEARPTSVRRASPRPPRTTRYWRAGTGSTPT